MSNLKFAETHNLVAFLEKPEESDGFKRIIDFLNANSIRYALTVNPTIYTSCIKQFWATAKAKNINGEVQIQALVDRKKVIVTETSVRRDLQLKDAEGTKCLPNATIFEQLTLMGYTNLTQKLTFYKAFFSPQWKFLIHTILQCLSAKTTAWNKFSSTMASAGGVKFLMYPGFVQVFLDKQVEGIGFSGRVTPLFQTMMVQAPKELVLDLENTKTSQAAEITKLKERVKKLERRNKSRTLGLKRLRKVGKSVQVVSSEDEGLGAQDDASKRGRKIADLDADAEVTLVDEAQGRNDDKLMFDTGVFDEQEVEVEKVVSTTEVTTVSATIITVDELTLAQTLIEIKAAKPKAVTTTATTTATAITRPTARGVLVQEPSEFTKTTSPSQLSQHPQAEDKGKEKIIEPEKPLKKKDQILIDEEIAQNLQAQLNA
ncbi:hypothetical protein Tco_0646775 [Tanacetum coccineum]